MTCDHNEGVVKMKGLMPMSISMAMCGHGIREKETTEQMSRDEGSQTSQYSINDGILPSLGATSRNRPRHKLRRFIITPFHSHYR